jgi:hypothetical protein
MPFDRLPNDPGSVPEGDLNFDLEGGDEGTGQDSDGSAGGESESSASFYDASKVPEELRASFTEMQGAMTKKSQKMSAAVRAAEAKAQALSEKAQTLDQIMSEPRFVAYLQAVASGQDPLGSGMSNDADGLEPEIQAQVERAVQPHKAELLRMQQRMALEQEKSQFVVAHPDWPKWKGAMDAEWNGNQHLTMEQAYGMARYRAAQRQADSRRTEVERQGTRGPAVVDNDAVKIAAESLRLDHRRFTG